MIGKDASQLRMAPYYFIDSNVTAIIATSLHYCGFDSECEAAHFKNEKSVTDERIIEHLGFYGREKSVWVTSDLDSKRVHARYILSKAHSVIWVFRPKSGLSMLHGLILMCLIIEPLNQLITNTNYPRYLRATLMMPNKKAKLEELISPINSPKMDFKQIHLL